VSRSLVPLFLFYYLNVLNGGCFPDKAFLDLIPANQSTFFKKLMDACYVQDLTDSPLIVRPLAQPSPRCVHFSSTGSCKLAERCEFIHDPLHRPRCVHFTSKGSCKHAEYCKFSHAERGEGDAGEKTGHLHKRYVWLYKMPRDPTEYQLLTDTLTANGFRQAVVRFQVCVCGYCRCEQFEK